MNSFRLMILAIALSYWTSRTRFWTARTSFAQTDPKIDGKLKDFIEKERPDWLQALIPRRINALSDYWPQKVLAVATNPSRSLCEQIVHDAGLP